MQFLDKTFNGMVDVMRWILCLEPASVDMEEAAAAHWQPKKGAPNYRVRKIMTRADSHERVRIVQNGQYFGAILDFRHPRLGWSPGHILRHGIGYSSPELAEVEARFAVPWLQDWKEQAGAPAKPELAQAPRDAAG
jgi:hypothetical protein